MVYHYYYSLRCMPLKPPMMCIIFTAQSCTGCVYITLKAQVGKGSPLHLYPSETLSFEMPFPDCTISRFSPSTSVLYKQPGGRL